MGVSSEQERTREIAAKKESLLSTLLCHQTAIKNNFQLTNHELVKFKQIAAFVDELFVLHNMLFQKEYE
jgi:hypothetical protein